MTVDGRLFDTMEDVAWEMGINYPNARSTSDSNEETACPVS